MKRICLLFAMVLVSVGMAVAAPKKVAVYVDGDMSAKDKSIVNSTAVARVSDSKDYKAFERNAMFIKALDKEHDYQVSGEVSLSEIRNLGERLGVDYVIVIVALIADDNECHMSARMIDLVSGEVVKSVSIHREYSGSEQLVNMANNVTYRLIGKKSK